LGDKVGEAGGEGTLVAELRPGPAMWVCGIMGPGLQSECWVP